LARQQKTTARVSKPRPSKLKGKSSKRTQFVRSIVKEVAG
jgi:large subunit ribosomal protein L36e